MGNSSRTFYILVAAFAILIMGLSFAIYQQRESTAQAAILGRLQTDEQHLTLLAERTAQVTASAEALRSLLDTSEAQFKKIDPRLFHADDKKALEALFSQVASAGRLDVTAVQTEPDKDDGAFTVHTYQVRMQGPMNGLPAWAEAVFRQRPLMLVDRVSVVSPEYQFQRVKIKATVRVFEAKAADAIVGQPLTAPELEVKLDYLEGKSVDNAVYGATMKSVQEKSQALSAQKDALIEASREERAQAGYTQLLAQFNELDALAKANRKQILDAFPTLYSRVQKSPLGSAAVLVQGKEVRFPEVTVDD